ncbi:hypothetical protein SCUP234_00347 [Seiridium cupressi]
MSAPGPSIFGGSGIGRRASETAPPAPPPTALQLSRLRPLLVEQWLGRPRNLVFVTEISYDTIWNLVVRDLSPGERTALAMTCKDFLRDVRALSRAAGPNYTALVNRWNSGLTGGELGKWLVALEKDIFMDGRTYCPWCRRIHRPKYVVLPAHRPIHDEDLHNPDPRIYECARANIRPAFFPDFNKRFHPLPLYWMYRVKKEINDFDEVVALEDEMDVTQRFNPTGSNIAGDFIFSTRHSAKVARNGIYLREIRTVVLYRGNAQDWVPRRFDICHHVYYEYRPTEYTENYLVSVNFHTGGINGQMVSRDQCQLVLGRTVVTHVKPFNHFYNCPMCNREFLIEPIAPQPSAAEGMVAGLKISVWFCIAWTGNLHGPLIAPPPPPLLLDHVVSTYLEPHLRYLTDNPPSLYPGTAARAFEGECYLLPLASP